jgi:hypothetical protein
MVMIKPRIGKASAVDHEIRPAMWPVLSLLAYRPTYKLLCIYKSSKQTGNLPGGM